MAIWGPPQCAMCASQQADYVIITTRNQMLGAGIKHTNWSGLAARLMVADQSISTWKYEIPIFTFQWP